jgi:RHS repeat-associated protein
MFICGLASLLSGKNVYASSDDFVQDQEGPSITDGTPAPDSFTGTMSYSVPIKVPKGRNGMAPKLALTYRSNNNNGWLGMGWELQVGSVERSTRYGVNLAGDDYVYRKTGGVKDLVDLNDGNNDYGQFIEGGEFNKIQKLTNSPDNLPYWVITNKSGVIFRYGYTSASRQDDPANPNNIFKWCLDQVQDTNGNTMTFSYFKDQGQIYLDEIDYTANGSLAPSNYVKFYRESGRNDAPTSYATGFAVTTAYLVNTIDVIANSNQTPTRVRAYYLGYDFSGQSPSTSITGRSHLTSITEYGSDAVLDATTHNVTGGTSLPPVSLGYNSIDTNFLSTGSAWRNPEWTSNISAYIPIGGLCFSGDVNGDGITDVACYNGGNNGTQWSIALSTGSAWNNQSWNGPVSTDPYGSKCATGDFFGDGKIDVACYNSSSSLWSYSSYIGNGWGVAYSGITSFSGLNPSVPISNQCRAASFVGTGQSDIACYTSTGWQDQHYYNPNTASGYLAVAGLTGPTPSNPLGNQCITGNFLGSGTAVTACYTGSNGVWNVGQSTWNGPVLTANVPVTSQCIAADFNGDGKTDLACNSGDGGTWTMAMSTGSGWVVSSMSGPVLTIPAANECLAGDINGDGIADLYCFSEDSETWTVALSWGSGWQIINNWVGPRIGGLNQGDLRDQCMVGDFNGDGKADLACYTCDNGQWTEVLDPATNSNIYVCYVNNSPAPGTWSMGLSDPFPTDLLSSISNGLGSNVSIQYTPSTAYQNTQLPFPVQTVSSVTACDNYNTSQGCIGNSSVTSYTYSGGYYYPFTHDLRGFNYVKATGPQGPNGEQTITETWYHQGTDTAVDQNNPSLAWNGYTGFMEGMPYRKRISDGNGNKISETTTQYIAPVAGPPFFNPPQEVDTTVYEGDPTGKATRVVYTYDSYGNVTRIDQYGDIANPTTDLNENRTITLTYTSNVSAWIVGLPINGTVYQGIGVTNQNQIGHADFYYDGASDCSAASTNQNPTLGNLSRVVSWYNNGTSPETWMGYDTYGNLSCIRDANSVSNKGNLTQISYDSGFTFPKTRTNPLGQQTTTQYYGVDGVPASNGLYGQVQSITDPNNASTIKLYDPLGRRTKTTRADGSWSSLSYNNFGTVGTQDVRVDTSVGTWSEKYFDGLGRTIKKRSSGPSSNTIDTVTQYDQRGAVSQVSFPYFEGTGKASYTTFIHDPVGRVIQTTKPDNSTMLACYDDWHNVFIDENSHRKRQTIDPLGRLIKVEEYKGTYTTCTTDTGTPYATTNYQYDALGHLINVTDTMGNQTTIHYDSLGRKDYMIDPDMGEWQYQYDLNGNLTLRTDANGQQVQFAYDALNRKASKGLLNAPSPDVTYTYDEPASTNPVGRLTSMTDLSGTTRYFYDQVGRFSEKVRTVDNVGYTIAYTYDGLDRVQTITYPDSEVVTNVYDNGGNISSVTGNTYDANGILLQSTPYATYSGYNALGQPGSLTFGNGAATNYSYYPLNNRLQSITTNSQSQTLVNLTYSYYNNGNIQNIVDFSDSASPQYPSSQSYEVYQGKVHAFGVTGTNFQYDANGNMTSDGSRTITYNYDNMPQSINGQVSFVYDGNGKRVKKITPNYTVTSIEKLYECTSGSCGKYIFAGKNRIALKNVNGTFYYHPDHLGSTIVVTNASGNLAEGDFYSPFGETTANPVSPFSGVNNKYTSQEMDSETGLYNYKARLYNAAIGRFISADTIVPDPTNPQSMNRYSYVLNNPINNIDPSGHDPNDDTDYSWSASATMGSSDNSGVQTTNSGSPTDQTTTDGTIGYNASSNIYGATITNFNNGSSSADVCTDSSGGSSDNGQLATPSNPNDNDLANANGNSGSNTDYSFGTSYSDDALSNDSGGAATKKQPVVEQFLLDGYTAFVAVGSDLLNMAVSGPWPARYTLYFAGLNLVGPLIGAGATTTVGTSVLLQGAAYSGAAVDFISSAAPTTSPNPTLPGISGYLLGVSYDNYQNGDSVYVK